MESNGTAFRAAYNGPEEDRNELSGHEQCVCELIWEGRRRQKDESQFKNKERKKVKRSV